MEWTWHWVPFNDGTSFGDNPFFDWLRVVCLITGVVLVLTIGRVLIEGRRRDERMDRWLAAMFVSIAGAVVYICATEFAVFGTPATPRLPVGLITLGAGIYAVRGKRRKQRANPPA